MRPAGEEGLRLPSAPLSLADLARAVVRPTGDAGLRLLLAPLSLASDKPQPWTSVGIGKAWV